MQQLKGDLQKAVKKDRVIQHLTDTVVQLQDEMESKSELLQASVSSKDRTIQQLQANLQQTVKKDHLIQDLHASIGQLRRETVSKDSKLELFQAQMVVQDGAKRQASRASANELQRHAADIQTLNADLEYYEDFVRYLLLSEQVSIHSTALSTASQNFECSG